MCCTLILMCMHILSDVSCIYKSIKRYLQNNGYLVLLYVQFILLGVYVNAAYGLTPECSQTSHQQIDKDQKMRAVHSSLAKIALIIICLWWTNTPYICGFLIRPTNPYQWLILHRSYPTMVWRLVWDVCALTKEESSPIVPFVVVYMMPDTLCKMTGDGALFQNMIVE